MRQAAGEKVMAVDRMAEIISDDEEISPEK